MNSIRISKAKDGTIFIPLPANLHRTIDGGCQCAHCKAHPDDAPAWDTLAVHPDQDHTWSVHYPELQPVKA